MLEQLLQFLFVHVLTGRFENLAVYTRVVDGAHYMPPLGMCGHGADERLSALHFQ